LYFSADIVRMIESWRMVEVKHVSCVGGKGDVYYYNVVSTNLKEGDCFDSVDVGERIMS
jgi:hypothetical protein